MNHFKEVINNDLQYEKEIIKSFTQTKPSRTRHAFDNCRNSGEYNHVGMDGGKYYVEKERLIKTLLILKRNGISYNSIVPQIRNKTIFFCDVDHLNENEKIEEILKLIKQFLAKEYDGEFIDNFYITKSKSLHRFHIYFPDIILTKSRLDFFWNDLNVMFLNEGFRGKLVKGIKKAPIDTSVIGGVRYDGFYKFNPEKSRYIENTEYFPYLTKNGSNFKLDLTFYSKTYLLIDEHVDCTRIIKKSPNSSRNETSIPSDNSQSLNTDNNNSMNISLVSTLEYSDLDGISSVDDDIVFNYENDTNSSNNLVPNFNSNDTIIFSGKSDDEDDDLMRQDFDKNIDQNHNTMRNLKKSDSGEVENDELMKRNLRKRCEDNHNKMKNLKKYKSNEIEEFFGDDAYDFLIENYPFVLKSIKGHQLQRVARMYKETPREITIISLGKTPKDRKCPFTKRVHRRNNTYYIWIEKTGKLQHRCHHGDCNGKFTTVYTKNEVIFSQVANDLNFDEDSDEEIEKDDLWTDIDVALVYLEMNKNLMYSERVSSRKGEDGMFFHFDERRGIWKADRGSYVLKKDLAKNFKKYIKLRWRKKISEAGTDEFKKSLQTQKALLMRKLGDFKNIKNILDALKTLCIVNVELDTNPWYIVANNMVWDLQKNEKVIPKKEEYITNTMTTGFDIVPFNEEIDEEIHNKLFKRLFPNDEERATILYYLSTTLNGPGGNNGKSKTCEIIKAVLGDYAHKASAKLLCGKDDAASFANFARKRFVYFEEPEFKKKIQSYLIKELTGGVEFSARKIYSSCTANEICATFALNTNNIPQFTQADKAMAQRLLTVKWSSRFTKDPKEVDESKHVYLADNDIGDTKWIKKYAPHIFNYLLKYHQRWLENGSKIPETESQKDINDDIIQFSDHFKTWLYSVITKTENKRDSIPLNKLVNKLLPSEYWVNMSKSVKKIGALTFLKRELKDRVETVNWLRKQRMVNAKRIHGAFLSGHRFTDEYEYSQSFQDNSEKMEVDEDENVINESELNRNKNKITGKRRLRSKSISMDLSKSPPKKKHRNN